MSLLKNESAGNFFGVWSQFINGCHRRRAEGPNDVWCWDFIFDQTESGSQLKWLSAIDEYTRECLALKGDRGIASSDVIDTLADLFAMQGVPKHIRSDSRIGVHRQRSSHLARSCRRLDTLD